MIAFVIGIMAGYVMGIIVGYHIWNQVKKTEIKMLRNALEKQVKQRIWENLYWELRQRIAKRVHYMNEN